MVNPSPVAGLGEVRPGYERQYLETLALRRDWAQVVLRSRKSSGVMENDYIDMEVFHWLNVNVGPTHNFIRNSKWADGNGWAYTFDHNRKHVFFFADRNIAVRFKLTWV